MASPSSSSYARKKYDVYLSFSGEDTRKSIIDHLYYRFREAGINVFRDDEHFQRGDNIAVSLLPAIQESRIFIVVFSKRYANSSWCLEELATIMECKERLNQIVIPVYYGVEPSEVRKQKGEFGYAFAEHEKRYEYGEVKRWRVSLEAASNLSGWSLQGDMTYNGFEPKFIESITNHVLRELNFEPRNVAKYPVGIDSRVGDILHLLQTQKNDDVKMIGIFGISGIGKSTLAKAIYNHLIDFQGFEGNCFVANIRQEVSNKGYNGLARLQEKILRKTLKIKFEVDNVEEGKILIKQKLQSKRVLIVLDDIDDISQLESLAGQRNWFGCGSIVIITTRNVNLLRDDLIKAHEKYEIETLSFDESSQLLSLHAFGVLVPPEEYTKQIKRIVGYTRGIPLALTVLGSHLREKSVEEWSNEVEKLGLKEEESNEVEKLGLEEEGSNEVEKLGLKEEESNKVEKLGLKEEGSNEDEKLGLKEEGSNEVEKLGLKEEGSKEVEKLGLRTPDVIQKIHRKVYDELDGNTRSIFLDIACFFIGLNKNDIVQDFGVQFETGIRTLIKRGLLTIHRSEEKEKLQMDPSVWEMAIEIIQNESPHDPSKRSRLMNAVDVYDVVIKGKKGTELNEAIEGMYVHSSMLKNKSLSTKVLSRMKNLRLLKLDGVHLKGSFKHLPKELRWFWWHNCPLKKIPSDFHHEKLEVFHLQGSNITSVQLKMQHFKNLRILNLGGCEQLEETPNFTGAENLQILSFKYCKNLVKLPSSIGCLESLIELDLASCQKLKMLPDSTGQLNSLQFLYLNDCLSLGELPFNLGKLGQLRILHAHRTNISRLPVTLGHLTNLNILSVGWHKDLLGPPKSKSQYFDNSHMVGFFPSTFGYLRSLEALNIAHNHLPDKELLDFKGLSSLKCLSIKGSYYLQSFPFSLSVLSRLEILELEDCPNLEELVQLPPSLLKLSAKNCPSLRKVNTSNLKRLKELYIPNCKSLIELPGLESLDSIHRLDITNCSALTIPLTENCYQAYSEGGDVEIWLQMVGSFLYCTIPLRHKFFDIIHGGFDPNYTCEAHIIIRSRTTGALIVKKAKHVDCRCLEHRHPLKLHFRLEDDNIVINKSERFHFRVRIKVGEEVEVYAVFQPLKIFSLCVLHRNRSDGEVRFFPCPKGFIEFDELAIDDATERDHSLASNEEVGNSREKAETGVRIVEITEEQNTQFAGQDEVMQSEDIRKVPKAIMSPPSVLPRGGEKRSPSPVAKKPSLSEQIQKLHDESTRITAEGSKLKRGILELLDDVAQLRSKEDATTLELSALLDMLKLQSKGYTTALEMTQFLLGALKNYEVERLYQNDTTGSCLGVIEMEESDPVSTIVEEDMVDPLQSDNTVGVRNSMRKLTIKEVDVSSDDDSEPHLPAKKSNNNEVGWWKSQKELIKKFWSCFLLKRNLKG
ncbi:PREDICTED: disease resistance protein TAO1-like [Ipomoea nil]|uniref:disease resistance protein TAO1-like n=1 Tax=Ipomoea nil TaxID=35883 RepID=UPI000900BA3B|nr:PREDICTED: disease resistance protein TAO1-like [Ipomoea nil]